MTIISINKTKKEIRSFKNTHDLIADLQTQNRQKFLQKHGFEKTDEMCSSHDCPNIATHVWDVPFLMGVKRLFTGEGNYPGCQSCDSCLKGYARHLKTPLKHWKTKPVRSRT